MSNTTTNRHTPLEQGQIGRSEIAPQVKRHMGDSYPTANSQKSS